ncbi:MAG: rhomboid family intramembrane serine protease [Cyanobacteria bacterium J06626_23]
MIETLPDSVTFQATVLGCILLVLWGLELFDSILLRGALNHLGIRPRTLSGFVGILFAPLLHGSLRHLAANTGPLMVLGWLLLLRGVGDFVIVTAVAWLVSGLGAWLLGGPRTNHLGASGIVFGYFSFLLLIGYFERSPLAIGLAALTGMLYSGMIWGVLPIRRGKSWQSHLFGMVGGGLVAWRLTDLHQWLDAVLLS